MFSVFFYSLENILSIRKPKEENILICSRGKHSVKCKVFCIIPIRDNWNWSLIVVKYEMITWVSTFIGILIMSFLIWTDTRGRALTTIWICISAFPTNVLIVWVLLFYLWSSYCFSLIIDTCFNSIVYLSSFMIMK